MSGAAIATWPAGEVSIDQTSAVAVFRVSSETRRAEREDTGADFDAGFRKTLQYAGFNQPTADIGWKRVPEDVVRWAQPDDSGWRIVAPGVIVREAEYEARFGALNLDELQLRMSPEAFGAFVRYIGIIAGPDNVDVNELADEQDA